MAYTAYKVVGDRGTTGPDGNWALRYVAAGSGTSADAIAAIAAVVPATFDPGAGAILELQGFSVSHVISGGYEVLANYKGAASESNAQPPPRNVGDSYRDFDFHLEPVHLVVPLETRVYGPDPKPAPVLIGDQNNDDPPEGCDAFEAVADFTETHFLAMASVSAATLLTWEGLVNTVNIAPFRGRPAESCHLQGLRGSQRGRDLVEISFSFRYRANLDAETILGVSGIVKKAWEFVWPYRRVGVESERVKSQATHVVVNRIFNKADWSSLPSRSNGM